MIKYLLYLFLIVSSMVNAQDIKDFNVHDSANYSADLLLEKYLSSLDSANYKIGELLKLSNIDEIHNDFGALMKKLQIAMVLAQSIQAPSTETYLLNIRLGEILSELNPRLAIDFFNKAIQTHFYLNNKIENLGLRFQIINMKAGLHSLLHERDSTLASYHLAIDDAQKLGNISFSSLQNNIGIFYYSIGMNDSASVYFQDAMDNLGSMEADTILYCSIMDNMAQLAELKKDFKTAIATYRFNDSIYFNHKRFNRYVVNKVRLFKAFNTIGSSEIDPEIPKLNQYINALSGKINQLEIIKFYLFASQYYIAKGKSKQGLFYNNLYVALRDSMETQNKNKLNILAISLLNAEKTRFKNELQVYHLSADKKELELKSIKQSLFYNKLIAAISIIAGSGIVILLFLVYRNFKRQQDTNKRLVATQQALIGQEKLASLGQMTAGIAHEIQNPLNFITNFSELSRENLLEIKNAKSDLAKDELLKNLESNLEKVIRHGKRADTIVRNMMEHSRTASGVKQMTDINHLCSEYLNFSYKSVKANHNDFDCQIVRNLSDHLPELLVMPMDISKVLLNLFNNAFYVLREKQGAILKVSTQLHAHFVEIKIRDNVGGIKDSIKQKIFEPFFTTKPSGQGTGLGLSISYNIIKAHEGELKLNSKENEFTEFVITLPLT